MSANKLFGWSHPIHAVALSLLIGSAAQAQGPKAHDPGVRMGPAGAGPSIFEKSGASADQYKLLFEVGADAFQEEDTVVESGLGPTMNLDSCKGCHSQPALGGSSPPANPQKKFFDDKLNHATNVLPSFIKDPGPVREVRFRQTFDPNNPHKPLSVDGGVHGLFTIAGMKGAEACTAPVQPDFKTELGRNNVTFRIPTPTFGAGLIEQIPDRVISDNLKSERPKKKALGILYKLNIVISGNTRTALPNRNGNDGTIARFGWKAQNKSLLLFAGEAYNVEMGISNELFQTERSEECQTAQTKKTPNDITDPNQLPSASNPKARFNILSDIEKFAAFMRYLAPPAPSNDVPGATPDSIEKGRILFASAGCGYCHSPQLKTGASQVAELSGKEVNLYSDLALHAMGPKLDDGVSQGQAKTNEFRSAPLWGLGQRIWFLHDGRTNDLLVAIQEHSSGHGKNASEANMVVRNFNKLDERQKQDLLNFLRSL